MATDIEKLIVSLEASFTRYERSWARAQGITDVNVKQTARKFDAMTAKLNNGLNLNTGNIAAQFQDIAVQLQGGASPFTVALQQGTQLSAALGSGGLKGTLSALGGAFVSLLSPVSLLTVGLIAAGGFAAQYFASLLSDGAASEEELAKHEDAIRRVAERWGDTIPALNEYLEKIEKAKKAQDEQTTVETVSQDAFKDVNEQLAAASAEILRAIELLQLMGNEGGAAADQLNSKFGDFAAKVRNGTATTADFETILAAVTELSNHHSIPAFETLTGVINGLAAAFAEAARKSAEVRNLGTPDLHDQRTQGFIEEQTRLNGLTSEQIELENEIARVKSEAGRDDIVLTEQQALDIAKQRLTAEERRAEITKSSRTSGREREREIQAVADLIAELEHEYELLGLTAEQQAISNALRQAGAAATDEQRQRIVELISATMEEKAALAQAEEALQAVQNVAKQAFSSFISDLRSGKTAAEALTNTLGKLADQLIDMALNQAIAGLFGGLLVPKAATKSVGSLIPGLGGFAGGTANTGGARGQVRGLVHGQEAVIPLPGSGKIPVDLRIPSVSSKPEQKVVNNVFNYGNDKVEQRPNSTGGVDTIINAAVAKVEKNMASGRYRPLGVGPGLKRS